MKENYDMYGNVSESPVYWHNDERINKILSQMKRLKDAYKRKKEIADIEAYMYKVITLSQYINVKPYLLEKFDGKTGLELLMELGVPTTTLLMKQVCTDQELYEIYLDIKGPTVLRGQPDEIYEFKIKGLPLIEYLLKYKHHDLDYIIEHDYSYPSMIDSIIGCKNIFEYLKKYNKEKYIDYMNPVDLLEKRDNHLLLDELIKSEIKPNLKRIDYKRLVAEILKRRAYYLLDNINESILLNKVNGKSTLFEFLLKKGIICKQAIWALNNGSLNTDYFLSTIIENQKYEYLTELHEAALVNLIYNGKTALEHVLENGLSPNVVYHWEESINMIAKLNKFEELQKCSEKILTKKINSGKTIIEELLDRNLSIEIDDIRNEEIAYQIYIHNRKDLYPKVRISTWLMQYDDKYTYLDWIIMEMKEDDTIDLGEVKKSYIDNIDKAQIYIIFAKHGIHEKYPLTKEELLTSYSGLTLLQDLLEGDEEITLKYLLPEHLKQEKEISMIIRLHELGKKQKVLKNFSTDTRKDYINALEKTYNTSRTTEDESYLLEELYNVMNDGTSDPELLYELISFYTYQFSMKNPCAHEVVHLINIKRNNTEFKIIKSWMGNAFSSIANFIELTYPNPDVLSHELGHALYFNLSDRPIDENIMSKIKELRQSKEFLKLTAKHSKEYYKFRESIEEIVEKYYMTEYDKFIEEEHDNLEEYLRLEERLKIELGYFRVPRIKLQDVIKKQREIHKNELTSFIMRIEYGHILSVSDIIDAIHNGEYTEGKLIDENGKEIIGGAGHGRDYYSRGDIWVMDELMADISQIQKSQNSKEGIDLLKGYIGEELTNMLIRYYEENILYSKKYEESFKL